MDGNYEEGIDPIELDPNGSTFKDDVFTFENIFFLNKRESVFFKSE